MDRALYDSSAVMFVLGALLRQPHLVHNNKYNITASDFDGLHEIIYSSIYNLSVEGAMTITPQNIDLYLKQFGVQYEKYKKENGYTYLLSLNELIPEAFDTLQFDYYCERIKKFTTLRDLKKSGIETKEFYNPDVDVFQLEKENRKLNDFTLEDIFSRLQEKLVFIQDKNINKENANIRKIGDGIDDLLKNLEISPRIGYPAQGEIINYAARGLKPGCYYFYSAPTGHGKTRFFVSQACNLSIPYIKDGKIITREKLTKTLYIATETDPEEMQILILAWISGIDEEKITDNILTDKERQTLAMAAAIMKKYTDNLIIETISDPSLTQVKTKISRYVLDKDIQNVFYDYIQTSPALIDEFARSGLREDVVLAMLSAMLKGISEEYDIVLFSGSQVNREWEKMQFKNENCLAGTKSLANKIDFGIIATRITLKEEEEIQEIVAKGNFKKPNVVMDVYKNRHGKLVNVKIFRYFNYGNCWGEDLFVTDTNYQVISVGKIKEKFEEEDLTVWDSK